MLNFELRSEMAGKSVLVEIEGDFDLQVGERVADELARIESKEPELLVLDLHRVSFLDSTGMGIVAAAQARATEAGRRFVVVRPPAGVIRAFEISGLTEHLTMVGDATEVFPRSG
jgi:anti-sigma B factor antagonist